LALIAPNRPPVDLPILWILCDGPYLRGRWSQLW